MIDFFSRVTRMDVAFWQLKEGVKLSANELFTLMLREQVAPALRASGFAGSGHYYRLRNNYGHHALIGLQKDRLNTAARCRFTINVAFYRGVDWDAARQLAPWLPDRPAVATVFPGTKGWQERIGFLGATPHDHWWTIAGPEDVPSVAADVIRAVREDALPRMRALLGGEQHPLAASGATDGACSWPGCHYTLGVDAVELLAPSESLIRAPQHPRRQQPVRLKTTEVHADAACRILKMSRRALRQASRYAGLPEEHQYTFGDLVALDVLRRSHSRRSGEYLPLVVFKAAFTAVRSACAQGLPEPDSKLVIHGMRATVITGVDVPTEEEPTFPAGEWWPGFVTDLTGFAHSVAAHFP